MRNDKFWDECAVGTIREKVAQFIDKTPVLSKFEGEQYYDLEDALVGFIENNRTFIADEVDREYHRDDLINQATEDYGAEAAQVLSIVPIKKIDSVIESWMSSLEDDDRYWDETWQCLSDELEGMPELSFLDDYDHDDIIVYMAYLQEWYAAHRDFTEEQRPACIDEFFCSEMSDDELAEYYRELAVKFKKEHNIR